MAIGRKRIIRRRLKIVIKKSDSSSSSHSDGSNSDDDDSKERNDKNENNEEKQKKKKKKKMTIPKLPAYLVAWKSGWKQIDNINKPSEIVLERIYKNQHFLKSYIETYSNAINRVN